MVHLHCSVYPVGYRFWWQGLLDYFGRYLILSQQAFVLRVQSPYALLYPYLYPYPYPFPYLILPYPILPIIYCPYPYWNWPKQPRPKRPDRNDPDSSNSENKTHNLPRRLQENSALTDSPLFSCQWSNSLARWLTHWLTHSTPKPTQALTRSLPTSLHPFLTHSLTHSLTHVLQCLIDTERQSLIVKTK